MALIRKSEFRQMTEMQLKEKLGELRKEMLKINAQRSTKTTPENPGRIKAVRKTIARILTVQHQMKTAKPQQQQQQKEKRVEGKKKVQGGKKTKHE